VKPQVVPGTSALTKQPSVSVIVVNWNGADVLPRCLDALAKQTFTDFEPHVIDNGSVDNSVDNIEDNFPGAIITRLGKNLGFAAANNRGAEKARGRWLAFLNNDAFPRTDWLEKLILAAENFPDYHCFASCLVAAGNVNRLDGAGDIYHISGSAWHRFRHYPVDVLPQEPEEVFSACAAASLIDRKAFIEAGGFNERFFSHYEDVDIGFRLRLAGHRCLFVPDAVVEHAGSASFGEQSDLTVHNGQRNMVWTYVANMPGKLFWRFLPAHLLSNLVFLGFYSMRGQAKAIWTAKWEALLGLSKAWEERKKNQANVKVDPQQLSQMMDHGWFSPYLLGRQYRRIQALSKKPQPDEVHS
jgi:GT2 family glycosyltransferase